MRLGGKFSNAVIFPLFELGVWSGDHVTWLLRWRFVSKGSAIAVSEQWHGCETIWRLLLRLVTLEQRAEVFVS